MKIFKKVSKHCCINAIQFNLCGISIPANSIIYKSDEEKTMYICSKFPRNYHGKTSSVILNVVWYDWELRQVGSTTLKNCPISEALYNVWVNINKPQSRLNPVYDYEKMMDHERRKKSGTGGVRLSKKSDEYTTDNLRYNQVTESAYWANMHNAKSGNASIIASSIR